MRLKLLFRIFLFGILAYSFNVYGQVTVNGSIGTGEYGSHVEGQNQGANGITWYNAWDETNLYFGIGSSNNSNESAVIYIDINPVVPVNGGSNTDGTNTGFPYDRATYNPSFRADIVLYFKSGYFEYRTANGAGGWSGSKNLGVTYAQSGAGSGNSQEISIPWSVITGGGKPASFNWHAFKIYNNTASDNGIYGQMPKDNPGGSKNVSAYTVSGNRFYTVSSTAIPGGTFPFNRISYSQPIGTTTNDFGAASFWDFTVNPGTDFQVARSNSGGDWIITNDLVVGSGVLYFGSGGSSYGQSNIGNVKILGGTLNLDQTNKAMTVGGGITISSGGTFKLSGASGGDVNLKGNWNRMGTFTPNSRAVAFNGTTPQTLTGATTFDYLTLNNDLEITAGNDVTVNQNLSLAAGKTLTINSFIKSGNVTNNGSIIVNDGASFIQTVGASYGGSGSFVAKSSSTSAANKYTFWSSPIFNQNMYGIFGANTPPFVMTYNTATNYYDTLINPATSVQGKGYSIKTAVASSAVSFSGVPNNGPISIALSTAGDKYNLVGNPYPSNLDLAAFYTANSANIGSTIWFWDYTGGSVASQNGSTASNFGYATYNALGGTWLPAPSGSAAPDVNYTKVGQAFIVEAASTTLSFDNNLRVADAGIVINKSSGANEGKFWLTLQTSYNAKITQAITYQNGASNNFDNYDSRAIGLGSDAFYSFANSEKVVIQGKSTFDSNDVVTLGNKHFEAGNFKIELTKKEGLFADGQAIYLRDKTLGTETNLQDGAYLFSSTAGDFSDRFEVVYSKSVLGTSAAAKSTLTVYRNGDDFVIDSPSKITSVEVYDASGKLVKSLKSNGNKETVSNLSRGVFILKITTATETVSKKVIK